MKELIMKEGVVLSRLMFNTQEEACDSALKRYKDNTFCDLLKAEADRQHLGNVYTLDYYCHFSRRCLKWYSDVYLKCGIDYKG